MSEYPKMLFKYPGPHEMHGSNYDYIVVEDAQAETVALADGWYTTTTAALVSEATPKPKKSKPKAWGDQS